VVPVSNHVHRIVIQSFGTATTEFCLSAIPSLLITVEINHELQILLLKVSHLAVLRLEVFRVPLSK
jgi:hypothetical protein